MAHHLTTLDLARPTVLSVTCPSQCHTRWQIVSVTDRHSRQSLPAVSVVTADNLEEFQKADKIVVIAYLPSATAAPAAEFSATADKHRDNYLFGLVTDPAAIGAAGVTAPSVVVYRSFDQHVTPYPYPIASASTTDLEEWLSELSIPVIGEVNGETYATYSASPKPLAYIFIDPSQEEHLAHVESLKEIALEHKNKMNFVWIDAIKFGDHAKALNLGEPTWPSFVIQDLKTQLKYPHDQSISPTAERVAEMVNKFNAGELTPELKSAAIPASQDESVYEVVGKTFDEVVFDESKDVFIELYASW